MGSRLVFHPALVSKGWWESFYCNFVSRANIFLDAVALVERLGRLPLALVFAGSYISKTTIVKYLELYNKSWAQLHGQMKKRNDYPERTIITTWQISFEEVKLRDEGAAKLLRLWGYLDNQELWYQLLLGRDGWMLLRAGFNRSRLLMLAFWQQSALFWIFRLLNRMTTARPTQCMQWSMIGSKHRST